MSVPEPADYQSGATVTVADTPALDLKTVQDGETLIFAGWNRSEAEADAGIAQYLPGDSFTMPGQDVTLYAALERPGDV